jgi:UDP-glucose 4-epimerase
MMRTLITGGAGFIGSHLAEELLNRGQEVWVIDDLSTGSLENIAHLQGCADFHFVRGTVTDTDLVASLVRRVDVIYHLAAAVGVRLIIDRPIETIETNIQGTEIVLRLASERHKKVVLASTSEVYGKNEKAPFSEEHDLVLGPTIKSRWSYACSKAIDEFLALAYWRQCKLPVVIVRFFNTVGPRQTGRYGMVIPNFVQQALRGEPITVFGDGNQSRCFTYVTDAVKAVATLAKCPEAVGQVFNIGSTDEVAIGELALRVKQLTGSPSEIVYVPYAEAYEEGFEDMQRRVPDITKIQRLIGYVPSMTIDEIMVAVIEYHRTQLSKLPAKAVIA